MSARRRIVGRERFEVAEDVVELGACTVMLGLGEHDADECGGELAVLVAGGGRGSRIAWTRRPPGAALQDPANRGGETSVGA